MIHGYSMTPAMLCYSNQWPRYWILTMKLISQMEFNRCEPLMHTVYLDMFFSWWWLLKMCHCHLYCSSSCTAAIRTRGQISINNAQSTRWSLHVQLSAVQNNIQTHLTQNFNLLDIFCVVRKCCGCRHWWRNVIIKKLKSWTEEPAPRWILLSMN